MKQKRSEVRWRNDGRPWFVAAMCQAMALAMVAAMAITLVVGADRYVANLEAGREVAAWK